MTNLPAQFAIISAVYNVNRFLGEFLSSLDAQTIDHDRVRIILVDDGSTDGSGEALDSWSHTTDFNVVVLHQDNAGQGAARNAGMKHLDGAKWVTFTDPDDFLGPQYLEKIDEFIAKHPSISLAVGHQQDYIDDGRSKQTDRHPLRYRFAGGDQLVDIDRFPRFINMSAATAFFRVESIDALALRNDRRIRPNFEDGHFVNRYLINQTNRHVGFVDSAPYHYRRRSDKTSTLQNAAGDRRRYTDVLKFGYLSLLEEAATRGPIPYWLQYTIIYELLWAFKGEESMFSPSAGLDAETCEQFHALVLQIRSLLDDTALEAFDVIPRATSQHEALLHGYKRESWHWPAVRIDKLDEDQGLVKLTYRFTGPLPREEFFVRGLPTAPRHAGIRDLVYFQRTLVRHRTVWLWSKGEIRVELNGKRMPLTYEWPGVPSYSVRWPDVKRKRGQRSAAFAPIRKKVTKPRLPLKQAVGEALANNPVIRRLFRGAWVLMDRDVNANDNAEHLFRHLRRERREINAWFVVTKGSPDWKRLRREGFKRLIPHGSVLWRALCLNASRIVSSHADAFVYRPFKRSDGEWRWKFTFLQHGITKDDLSRWLAPKPIDGLIAATAPEFNAFAGSGSPYPFTTKEVALTGFPRHDRLAKLASSGTPRLIVLMPSWRQYLTQPKPTEKDRRPIDFMATDFAQQWQGLLTSHALSTAASDSQLEVVFMPHPNLLEHLDKFQMPSHFRSASFATTDVQGILAQTALLITDYSSVAFDAAAIRRPVAYFQFDRDLVFGGAHTTREGYFDYVRDGFGPVVDNVREMSAELPRLLKNAGVMVPKYAERADTTFAALDGRACERVTKMILDQDRRLSKSAARTPIATPVSPRQTPGLFD